MKHITCLLLLCAFFNVGFAQELDALNAERIQRTKNGMLVLGGWSVANIAANPFLAANSSGADKAFYQTNVYWNLANLAIAGMGYFQASKQEASGKSLKESWKEQQQIEKIILFNAGFDFAYMAAGLYVRERANTTNNERMKGVGESIFFQGSFLLVYDIVFYSMLHNTGNKLLNRIEGVAVSPKGFYLGIQL